MSLHSSREDDDINDVASMAGVNLKEESVRILASGGTAVGSVVQSCHDMPFLSPSALHARILHAGPSHHLMLGLSVVIWAQRESITRLYRGH